MARISSLLAAFVSVSVVFANPIVEIRNSPITMPIVARINATGAANFVESQRARARRLVAIGRERAAARASGDQERMKRAVISDPVTNEVVTYIASVGVGSPATQYNLLVDTGSSNTWVGAGKAYVRTSTSTSTGGRVSVTYGSGEFSGNEFTDQVTLASGLVIPKQSIGVATSSSGFQGEDGILGIGPVALTEGTVSNANTVPTVTDNLFAQGTITSNEIGISFEPTTSTSVRNGELTFGGTDSSKFTGSVVFTPITGTSPANEFWGINESITYGGTTIQSSTAGIVDTGTTLVLIATGAFNSYQRATGAVLDNNTGLLRVTSTQFNALQNLNFVVGGTTFALTPNAQLFPRSLNTQIGGASGSLYLIVADLGTPAGEGLDFINGYAFLERFYSVFDTTNRRVGFASTPFTTATTN